MLYEDPDQSSFNDRELMLALQDKVNDDQDFPVPEGFKKVLERVPNYSFKVPECVAQVFKESQVVATEMMDQIMFEAVGIHFLEPQVSFSEKWKIKTAITKKKVFREPNSYMKAKSEKPIEDLVSMSEAPGNKIGVGQLTAEQKRLDALEVKPKLSLALKM